MVLQADKERVHMLLKDTITLLCRNGLTFKSEFSVEALIGITLDKNDVFLININESIKSDNDSHSSNSVKPVDDPVSDNSPSDSCNPHVRNRRKRPTVQTIDNDVVHVDAEHAEIKRERNWTEEDFGSLDDSNSHLSGKTFSEPVAKRLFTVAPDQTAAHLHGNSNVALIKSETEESWDGNDDDEDSPEPSTSVKEYSTYREVPLSSADPSSALALGGIGADRNAAICATSADEYQQQLTLSQSARSQKQATTVLAYDLHPESALTDDKQQEEQMTPANNLDLVASMYNDMVSNHLLLHASSSPQTLWSPGAGGGEPQDPSGLPYPCHVCGKRYLKRDGLVRHLKTHDKSLHRCKRCTLFFPSVELLTQHIESRHGQGNLRHECAVCGRRFDRPFILRKHMQVHEHSEGGGVGLGQ